MLYEWREYKIVPGRMPAIKARFRDITLRLFVQKARHRSGRFLGIGDRRGHQQPLLHAQVAGPKAS